MRVPFFFRGELHVVSVTDAETEVVVVGQGIGPAFEGAGAGRVDDRLVVHLRTVGEAARLRAGVKIVFCVQAVETCPDNLERDEQVQQFPHQALGVLDHGTMDSQRHLPGEHLVAPEVLQPPDALHVAVGFFRIGRHPFQREDVEEDAEIIPEPVRGRESLVADLPEIQWPLYVRLRGMEGIDVVLPMLDEPVVVGPGHPQVDVIVPGDEPLVTHGAKHRPPGEIVADAVFLAEGIHVFQDSDQPGLDFFGCNSLSRHAYSPSRNTSRVRRMASFIG